MDLFLFTNYFPFKKAEPFLLNEFGFTNKYFSSISVLALYGELKDSCIEDDKQVHLLTPVLNSSSAKGKIFLKGLFNFAPWRYHLVDFFHRGLFLSLKKMYWFFTSLFVTRMVLSSRSYREILWQIRRSENPVMYFYWGDNLAWIIPYLKKDLKNKPVKIIIRLHRTDLYENLKADYAPLRPMIFSQADLIIPISADGKNYLDNKYPAFKNKIFLSRLGVFDHGSSPINKSEHKHIISVSGLVEVKRVHLIFELLQKTQAKITWHHFGDGPLAGTIQELVKHKRANMDVILHGYVDNKKLIDFYKCETVDLFINVSASEGLPVSIMEALSFGTPVVATNVGGTAELVDDSVGRLLDKDFKIDVAASEIDRILSLDYKNQQTLRNNARDHFQEMVNAEINYLQFYDLIQRV